MFLKQPEHRVGAGGGAEGGLCREGFRWGEASGTCPRLVLVENRSHSFGALQAKIQSESFIR